MNRWQMINGYGDHINSLLGPLGYNLNKTKKLADAVLQLSDFYIDHPGQPTPWDKQNTLIAHLIYYFPLNYIRSLALLAECDSLGFLSKENEIIDFGAGLSPLAAAINDKYKTYCVELDRSCSQTFQRLFPNNSSQWFDSITQVPRGKNSTIAFSYSLPELSSVPDWIMGFEKIIILEPSDRITGRKVLQLRQKLIDLGYYIWAPCTHNMACPLLKESPTDWCHNREFWSPPDWFLEVEKQLPIKNRTLTYSYILASRTPPPKVLNQFSRLTGDPLIEKGKTRQMVCRSDKREFLAWLKRDGMAPEWKRGELVQIETSTKVVGNELRPSLTDILDPEKCRDTLRRWIANSN